MAAVGRRMVMLGLLLVSCASSPSALAAPGPEPWPNIRFFERLEVGTYVVPGADGVWFLAPTGQNCGIWDRGSFACSGDIPGTPAGTRALGWVVGDRAMHYDWSVAFRMPSTPARSTPPPRTFIEHQGTTCAVTADAQTYCERGPLRFLIESAGTWLTPPWMDLRRN